ncbi:hypothetical protein ONE63_004137 [Megalurothrips usitatus]|uniref:Nipped-B protein n=1 Tax=Megalurothrips usitatus TaxID=439358 RepID=A0AAV7X5U0_9NEOP|nr:hypothetical protein ONE63_004137 [Megalurothrips usitatus]
MNGEIPSVPITTLAGIASLTDLLPEMPLPSPLPLSSKSLLFHPRVAEEAQNLLSVRDESLVPQLIQSLSQTSSQHIELKDHYAGTEPPVEQQQNIPELLKAILHRNPNVFKGPPANVPAPTWNQNFNCNDSSPASYSQASPNLSYSSPVPGHLTQDPIPGPALVPILPPDPGPQQRVSVITEQYKPPTVINNCEQSDINSAVLVKEESLVTQAPQAPRSGGVQGDLPNSTQEPSSIPRTNAMHIAGSSPAQASTAPVTQEQERSKHLSGRHSRRANSVNSNADAKATGEAPVSIPASVQIPDIMKLKDLKEPVVRLNRLSAEDQALMQKSLKAFAEKSPSLANQLGILSSPSSNHRSAQNSTSYKEESGSDSDEPLQKSKYFKAREREREVKRLKEKDDRKKSRTIESDDEYVPDDSVPQSSRKRRHGNSNDSGNQVDDFVPKTKLRRVERKVVPAAEKLSVEELMETNTYQRFIRSIELVFDNTEDLDLNTEMDDDADVPPEALIAKYQLQELCGEAAKLKNLGAMESIPADRLVRLLNILEKNIRDGVRVCPLADPDEDEEESKLWLELAMERVMRAVDASLTAMYILTSPNMHKRIYLEDVIDRVVVFCKFQLVNTIYPSFDPVYRVENKAKANSKDDHSGSGRKKRQTTHTGNKDKSIQTLYNKVHELVGLLSELLNIQVLTDTTVLHASTLGVAPFFVESVSELQLSALRLVTSIFTKYEKHRRLLLDDILASIARLPSSKRSLRTYRLSSDEHIQMLTALVLQLIQCVVVLPEKLQDQLNVSVKVKDEHSSKSKDKQGKDEGSKKEESVSNLDRDVLVVGKYDTAMRTAANFLSVFLNKCGNKSEDIDYRPLFENFVQDLLTTVNKPEWPAAELLLSLLGTLLVANFGNKGTDMALRVASLDYLGVVAARLRKDAVQSRLKVDHIDQIIKEIKAEESKDEESGGKSSKQGKVDELDEEEERNQFLQRVLLDYLAVNGHNDQALIYARHFYLAQWYKDASADKRKSPSKSPSKKKNQRGRKKRKDESSEEESDHQSSEDEESRLNDNIQNNSEKYRLIEMRKNFLISKIRPFQDSCASGSRQQVLQTYLDYNSAELITRFLASKRQFSQSFDAYLKQILRVLTETSIAIRTKAMKCLTMVVEADPSVLGRVDMQLGVRHSFLDHSTSVREAAVDLVGKFVLSRPELIDTYYEMLSVRILDTGVSVRKRVIKILKDICMECPDFPKIPEICVKMIRRVNDEEGIRKLVMEVFQNMWFTPVRERPTLDTVSLIRKVMNITDVVATSREIGMEWFEQLLVSLFKPREDKDDSTKVHSEPPKALLTACKQIVDCLIENVLRLEESSNTQNKGSSQRLVACLTTLNLFAKIRPQLLVNHAITLQPYLSLRCQTQGDYQIISCVARTLELVVPLMEHPSETFLAQLEEDSVKLILLHDRAVVASCLSCLGSVVNNVTRNFKLIRDCFNKYYGILRDAKEKELFSRPATSNQHRPLVHRALFTVGLLLRHFDFTDKDVIEGLDTDIKNKVFDTLMYFVNLADKDLQNFTLRAIGSLCIRHYEFMLQTELKTLYHRLLTCPDTLTVMRVQVLNNIEMYLEEEEQRMIRQDQEWAKLSKQENLKEMGDVTSGMASTVIQLYLKEVMEAFLHPEVKVRHAALKVIQLILAQGLVHPVQIVPYLICMSTDMEKIVSHSADKQLQDIEKKYPGFIHMKSQLGIRLAFKLHCILQQGTKGEGVPPPVRGFRQVEGEPLPTALNGFLYSILRSTKQQRRALVLSILKQFDEQAKTSLPQMLYYADNLAYFPYQAQDEPLFIIHHIDIMISVTGTNLLQTFREALIPLHNQEQRLNLETGQPELVPSVDPDEDEDEDVESLLARVPECTTVLHEVVTSFQGCLLLLVLKQHLKDLYGFTDAKITQYSPSEAAKVYEKAVNRRSNSLFNPKATLAKLKEGNPPDIPDQAQKKALVVQYLDFKQLMLKFDPDDADDEEEGSPSKSVAPGSGDHMGTPGGAAMGPPGAVPTLTINTSHSDSSPDKIRVNNMVSDGTPQRVPKLTIVAPKRPEIKERHHRKSHKSEKHKKHRHKKKRKKYGDDSDEESEEYSDPDFLV